VASAMKAPRLISARRTRREGGMGRAKRSEHSPATVLPGQIAKCHDGRLAGPRTNRLEALKTWSVTGASLSMCPLLRRHRGRAVTANGTSKPASSVADSAPRLTCNSLELL
jgi:hypothetical protein